VVVSLSAPCVEVIVTTAVAVVEPETLVAVNV
jgi:hypothetical protein